LLINDNDDDRGDGAGVCISLDSVTNDIDLVSVNTHQVDGKSPTHIERTFTCIVAHIGLTCLL